MINAIYSDSSSFSVAGCRVHQYRRGRKLRLIQGVDSIVDAAVLNAAYDTTTGYTTVTVSEAVVTANLVSVDLSNSEPETIAIHDDHGLPMDNLTAAQVQNVHDIPLPRAATADQFVGENATCTRYEGKTLSGTENQVNVVHAAGQTTMSLPQDVDESAEPTFPELTLSGLTGILVTESGGAISAVEATGSDQFFRRNLTDDGFEFVEVNLPDPPAVGRLLRSGLNLESMQLEWQLNWWPDYEGLTIEKNDELPEWGSFALSDILSPEFTGETEYPGAMIVRGSEKWWLLQLYALVEGEGYVVPPEGSVITCISTSGQPLHSAVTVVDEGGGGGGP